MVRNTTPPDENAAIDLATKLAAAHARDLQRQNRGEIMAKERWPILGGEVFRQVDLIRRHLRFDWKRHASEQAEALRVDTNRGPWIELARVGTDIVLRYTDGTASPSVIYRFLLYPPPADAEPGQGGAGLRWVWQETDDGPTFT